MKKVFFQNPNMLCTELFLECWKATNLWHLAFNVSLGTFYIAIFPIQFFLFQLIHSFQFFFRQSLNHSSAKGITKEIIGGAAPITEIKDRSMRIICQNVNKQLTSSILTQTNQWPRGVRHPGREHRWRSRQSASKPTQRLGHLPKQC